ncbi:MAG: phosphatase PAP2 family protein [Bacteroidetes bacterium]|nr:phosphatase PAP2 family protein [Bacteroidota bacterium]
MSGFFSRQVVKDFSILIFILGVLTLLFRFTNLDIRLEHYFYSADKGWMLQYQPFWDFIYRFGIFPGYLLAFGGLIMISLSYWNNKYVQFRKISLVLVFTMVVGPGLVVNLVLKDHTGRPRPREITEFGGTENYLCICQQGKTNEGKSFPCGHCSMGFYLAIPYLFYRKRNRLAANIFLSAGIGYGILIGIARMMAGGHFASDVVWAGGLTWGVALAGVYLFRLDKPIEIPVLSSAEQKKRARRATLITGILLPVITVGLMLATPYFSKKYIDVSSSQLKSVHCKVVEVDLKDATVTISPGKGFHLDYKVNAFGFPNSKIRGLWSTGDTCRYTIQHMGWFTEVKNNVTVEIPAGDSITWHFSIRQGRIICNLPDSCKAAFRFSITKGDLLIRSNPASLTMVGDPARIGDAKQGKPRCFRNIPAKPEGTLIVFELGNGAVIF